MEKTLKGFTLIELLVVIGIIGLLVSTSLAVISEVRDKGKDTRIQTSLAQVRFEAVMIYNKENSYLNLCDAGDTLNDTNENLDLIENDIRKYSGQDPDCYAIDNAYCVQARLVTDKTKAYCVDSTGFAGIVNWGDCEDTNYDCASP